MEVVIRAPQPGDGDGLARCWIDAGTYYANRNPELFQVPEADGLAEWFEASVLHASDDRLVRFAEIEGQVVGFTDAMILQPISSAPKQFVRDVGRVRVRINVPVVRR